MRPKYHSMVCLHHGCPYCPETVLPIAIHNIKAMFDFKKQVHIVYTDVKVLRNPLEIKLLKFFRERGEKELCPTGFTDNIMFNYIRSVAHFVNYLEKFFLEEPEE